MVEDVALRASAYNMASKISQEIVAGMAHEFERELIISGNVPLSIVRQRKADEMKLSEQKDSSRYSKVFECRILYERGAVMPPYALQMLDVLHPSDVREINYNGNTVSITSGIEKKTYRIIENKGGKVIGIKFKEKVFVEG